MTKREDFEKLIEERLKSFKKPANLDAGSERAVKAPENVTDSDEGVDKDKAGKRLKKSIRKRNKGYVNRKWRK